MDIRFGDHPSFHRAAAGMVGSSLLLGLALHPITPLAPLVGGVVGTAMGAAIGYGRAPLRLIAGALATIPLFLSPMWGALAISAGVLSLGLAFGNLRGAKGALAVMLGTLLGLVAMWTALRIGHARQTATWPALLTAGVAAAAMGMVGILAMLPRHLSIAVDPVQAALRRLPAKLDPEVRALCNRSASIWSNVKDQLGAEDSGKTLVRDGVLKTLEVAAKSAEVVLPGSSDDELNARMADLDRRIAAATDTEVKTQYQAARAALDDQQRYRGNIRQNRERLVARMHNHVAALEKFQLAATGLETAKTAAPGKQLAELSQEVLTSSDALAEVELAVAPASA